MVGNNRFSNTLILTVVSIFTIVSIEFFILFTRKNNSSENLCNNQPKENGKYSNFDVFQFQNEKNLHEFKLFGKKSDKTYTHHYEEFYSQLLGPFRQRKINFLEIGLGCGIFLEETDQSIKLWRNYLPQANLSILFESDEKCALELKNKVENVFMGDSSDLKLLQSIGQKYGPFDFVVDDEKRHTIKTQINGLDGFWPHLKSKGVYVIEDIFLSKSQTNEKSSLDLIFKILELFNDIRRNNRNHDDIPIDKYANDIVRDLLSIHCCSHACAFIKK